MARPNFFNDNLNRSFPFLFKSVGMRTPATGPVTMLELPDSFIVDCGFILGPESGFVEGTHSVFLNSITRITASLLAFEFLSDAPGVLDYPLVFYRDIADPKNFTTFAESDIPDEPKISESLSISVPVVECGEPFWSGYLTTGDLSKVVERLAEGEHIIRTTGNEAIVEPALVQNLNDVQLVSINIANEDRTRAVTPSECPDYVWPFVPQESYVNSVCLQGDIELKSGYNVALVQDSTANTIEFSAIVNAGEGQPCKELELFPGEAPPLGSTNGLFGGDYYCNEVFRTINGLQGPVINLYAGVGVSILVSPETNTVIININLLDLASCTYSQVSESI